MNSAAVIISALLISPLMGPINGMGYSIATYNFTLFKRAFRNYSFAVLTGLLASATYFFISLTIYDVIIALYGGMAGIVAISCEQKGNVIAGVAIATASMPPLCTAGYGLATAQYAYFFGAFYLFTINTVFIALSSVIFSQILKFPIITIVEPVRKRRIHQSISVISVIVLLSCIYFGYELIKKEQFSVNAQKSIQNVNVHDGNYRIRSEYNFRKMVVFLDYAGNPLSEKQKAAIREKAAGFDLSNIKIEFGKGLLLGEFKNESNQESKLTAQVFILQQQLERKKNEIDSISNLILRGNVLLPELRALFPQIESCSYTPVFEFSSDRGLPEKRDLVLLAVKQPGLNPGEKSKVLEWLKIRMECDSLRVIYLD